MILMNVWNCSNWRNILDINSRYYRVGIRLQFDKNVDSEVKRAVIEFTKWLRSQYFFPVRVPIYFKAAVYVRTQDGDRVTAKIFEPFNKANEPYISIATGEIKDKKAFQSKDNFLAGILGSMVHELTHYFQWVNDIDLTDRQAERQANYYRKKIIQQYALTREHP